MAIREIIFRGKRVDNSEWVYGFLVEALDCVTDKNETFIIEQDATYFTHGEFACAVEVKPETIGQFTGLCDENGRKIFEGDIVESPRGTQGFVEWQNAECAFLVNIGDDWQTMDDCTYEVIGNKYDNKEEE